MTGIRGCLINLVNAMKRMLSRKVGSALLVMFAALSLPALAQLELVADINQIPAQDQSNPAQFTAMGSLVIFVASSGSEGRELWKTDGTEAGTALVKDINPGNLSSSPTIIAVVGSVAYFGANDGAHGVELWKTDGTEAGTVLVKDIFPGAQSSNPVSGVAHNGALFFTAQDTTGNTELWTSDGTESGTVLVRDLRSNVVNPGSSPNTFVSAGSTLFFRATTDAQGTELWKTDGTFAGTVLVKDLTPGSSTSFFGSPVVMGGILYFSSGDGSNGNELWKSDGTTAGTLMVKNINPGAGNAAVNGLLVVGSTLYFSASSGSFNNELWKSDGTDAGTVLVKEIRPGTGSFQGSDPFALTAAGSTVFFFANDGTTGIELWKSDGTDAGTVLVKDLLPGTGFGARVNDPGTAPPMLQAIGTNVYFYATDGAANGGELWKSDGTSANTVMVKDIMPGAAHALVREMKAIGSRLYFSAKQPLGGTEPYISDGTGAGTGILKDVSVGGATSSSNPKHLTASAGKLYFSANDGIEGRELWVADDSGAQLTRAVSTNVLDNTIFAVGALNGTVFFGSSTDAGSTDYLLFRSDGTSTGTFPVAQAPPLSPLSILPGAGFFQSTGNYIFFEADSVGTGTELWRTDGTALGTFMLKDMVPGPGSSSVDEAIGAGNVLYFVSDTDAYGREVWRSDGTSAGTLLLKDIEPGGFGSDPYSLFPVGSTLYFGADSSGGNELFKSNGTTAGTVLITDVNSNGSSFANPLAALNASTILFTAFDPANGTELWKTNGTAAGTVMVKDIRPGSSSSSPLAQTPSGYNSSKFAVAGGVAYFSADDGSHGRELWKSDGTAAGTGMVKDIVPGASASTPQFIIPVDNKVYFTVIISGNSQLWTSDGTDAGTVMVDDQVINMTDLVVSGTSLYLVGSRSDVATELFRLPGVRTAPFTVTQSPGGQNPAPGTALNLAVTTTGQVPTCQWRKDGVIIPGATKTTFSIPKVAEANQGTYDALLRYGDFEVLSGAAVVNVTDPAKLAITQQPLPKLALTGSSVTFSVGVIGQSPSFQWYKGTAMIPGATTSTLTINPVQMSDAALYKVKVSNTLGSLFSSAVQLAVVNSASVQIPGKSGATVSLSAPVSGTGLTFRWLQNSSLLSNGDLSGRISGATTSKLNIAKFATGDQSNFTCLVSLGGQSVISGILAPKVAAIPVITAVASPPNWIISQNVSVSATTLFTQSNLASTPWNAPTSFSITGLPAGMKYDTKTGLITGRPAAGGGTNITLTIKVGNVAGTITTPVSVVIAMEAFPALAKGTFRGLADRSDTTLNDNLGNFIQVDISAIGSLSGKLYRGTTSYPFTTRFVDTTPGSTTATALVTILRTGTTALSMNLSVNGASGTMNGSLTDGTNTANFDCTRIPWIASGAGANPASAYAKPYTAAIQFPPGSLQINDIAYPQGYHTVVATISTAGVVSGAFRIADGTRVTFSTMVGANGQVPLYTGLYSNTGSLHGWTAITSATGFWDNLIGMSFFKAPQPLTSTTRSYKGGVPLHALVIVGSVWTKPTPSALLLGVTDSGAVSAPNNAEMRFTQGGITSSFLGTSGMYDPDFRIKAPSSSIVLPVGAANPGKLTLTLNSVTGEFSGSFSSSDANPLPPNANVPRSAPYFGVIVQRTNRGWGHFNFAKLPDVTQTNSAKTDILSGLAEFKTLP